MTCKHENLEHFPANDINEGSLPFTICLDCDISPEELKILLEPLEPEDKESGDET